MAITLTKRIKQLPGYTEMGVRIAEGTTVAIEPWSWSCSDDYRYGREAIYLGSDGQWHKESWEYNAVHAVIDAVPEIARMWAAKLANDKRVQRERAAIEGHERRERDARYRALKIWKGSWVEVYKGRKVPKGTVGRVIWIGDGKFGPRVGIADADGEVHWTALDNVRKLALAPETARRADALRLEAWKASHPRGR